jgi:hypothetical protein
MTDFKPGTALIKFLSNDCCSTGRSYPSVNAREIKEFKEACSPEEYSKLGQQAIDHLNAHKS